MTLTRTDVELAAKESSDRLLAQLHKDNPLAILPRWMTETDERNTQ